MSSVTVRIPALMNVAAHPEGFGIRLHATAAAVGVWVGQGRSDALMSGLKGAYNTLNRGYGFSTREEAEQAMKDIANSQEEIMARAFREGQQP